MKITFLGTSHGVPSPTRYCSATLLEVEDRAYLIDAGAPVADLLIRLGVPFEKLKAVFTTHIHDDHTAGLPALCSLANWYYKESDFDIYMTEVEGIRIFRQMVQITDRTLDERRLRFHLASPGAFYDDGTLRVTAIPTRHMEEVNGTSYAYLIEARGRRILFTGDLHGEDAADFPAVAAQAPTDLIVCEMAHFGPEVIFPRLAACPVKQVLFNHVYHDYEASMAAIRAAAGKYPFEVRAVEDGDVVEL